MRAGKLLAEGTAESLRARAGRPTLEEAFLALAGALPAADASRA
jgi:hypothetical protein